jgi:predicted ATPase
MAIPRFYQGEIVAARTHFEEAGRLYARAGAPTTDSGQDPGVLSRGFLGIALALLGLVDQAAERAEETLALARESGHPFTLASALHLACLVAKYRRDAERVAACAAEELAIAREYGFAFWHAGALVWSGWAKVQQGDVDAGLALMKQGLDAHHATGAQLGLPAYLADYAGACAVAGRREAARDAVNEALDLVERAGESLNAAELYRLRGELLSASNAASAGGEADLLAAVDIARHHGQLLLELRAAVSLARHHARHGRPDAGRAVLEPLLAAFPEGRDLPDMEDAERAWAECR